MSIMQCSAHLLVARRSRFAALTDQAARFTAIGVAGTLAYLGLYLLLDQWFSSLVGNAVAWLITTVLTNDAQRRLAFRVGNHLHVTRDIMAGLVTSAVTLVVTTVVLTAVNGSDRNELLAILAVNTLSGAARFLVMRWWFSSSSAVVAAL